jgi:hypothetical protein
MTNMKRALSTIRASLLIGICGGVPSKDYVRLGNIIFRTRVMQYDLGKLSKTVTPRKSSSQDSSSIGQNSCVAAPCKSRTEPQPSLSYPTSQASTTLCIQSQCLLDFLLQGTYDYVTLYPTCDECNRSRLLPRIVPMPDAVKIHYGAVASRHQVMTHELRHYPGQDSSTTRCHLF